MCHSRVRSGFAASYPGPVPPELIHSPCPSQLTRSPSFTRRPNTTLTCSITWMTQGGMRAEGLLTQTLVWTFNTALATHGPLYAHLMLFFRRMTIPPSEAPMVVFVPSNKSYHWKRVSSEVGTSLHRLRVPHRHSHWETAQTSAVRSRLLLLRR